MVKFALKKDKYSKARGDHSWIIEIHCDNCKNLIAIYQKDGPGPLQRMYLDRICYPSNLVNLQKKDLDSLTVLRCPKCKHLIAMPYVYQKEKRKAFRIFQNAIFKKRVKKGFFHDKKKE